MLKIICRSYLLCLHILFERLHEDNLNFGDVVAQ